MNTKKLDYALEILEGDDYLADDMAKVIELIKEARESVSYNGWTNRETWATALHINNDSGLYENIIEQVKNYANEEQPITGLASEIEQFISEVLDYENVQSNYAAFSMLTDIGSLYRVNWQEIAESFLSELVKEKA